MLLQGQKAIVTGASSGIGMATAERLGREGASVCVNYYSERERAAAEQVVAAIEQGGSKAVAVQADVANEEDVRRMVAQAGRELGGLDLLVNNGGIEKQVPLLSNANGRAEAGRSAGGPTSQTNDEIAIYCPSCAAREFDGD